MVKRFVSILTSIIILCLSFSSCSTESLILPADSLLSPPLYYEEYEELVGEFNKNVESETTLCNPRNGTYRSAIIVEDIDSDGNPEAVIFYKYNDDATEARMHYFDFVDGRWVSFGDFNGYGSEVENVSITDMDSDGKCEILIMWNTLGTSSGNVLTVYRSDSLTKKYKEISNESCILSEIVDIDGNGKKEIFLIGQLNSASGNQKVAKAMKLSGDSIVLFGETKLDANISSYSAVKTEKTSKDSPMRIYIDAFKGEQQMITEVVYWDSDKSELCAPLLDFETMSNSSTLRYEPIGCTDINNDGIIDIPVQSKAFGKGDNAVTVDTEDIYLTEWMNLTDDGLSPISYTLVNYQDGYMINLDESELNSMGIRNYRSQNCWIIYLADVNGEPIKELFSVLKIPVSKWNTDKFSAYIPVIEYEDSVVCVYITSDGKSSGVNDEFVKFKINKIT